MVLLIGLVRGPVGLVLVLHEPLLLDKCKFMSRIRITTWGAILMVLTHRILTLELTMTSLVLMIVTIT
jgi:hypothetical protein